MHNKYSIKKLRIILRLYKDLLIFAKKPPVPVRIREGDYALFIFAGEIIVA